jgi:hypothetical protein
MSIKLFHAISKSIYSDQYKDLGLVFIDEESTIHNIILSVFPKDGFHKDIQYIITLKFQNDDSWPLVYIDSEIFDKIKTERYIQNKGKSGTHKGICIKNLSHAYSFHKYFKQICDNKWDVYIYYLIITFNNVEDFKKGNGFKSNYKEILEL